MNSVMARMPMVLMYALHTLKLTVIALEVGGHLLAMAVLMRSGL